MATCLKRLACFVGLFVIPLFLSACSGAAPSASSSSLPVSDPHARSLEKELNAIAERGGFGGLADFSKGYTVISFDSRSLYGIGTRNATTLFILRTAEGTDYCFEYPCLTFDGVSVSSPASPELTITTNGSVVKVNEDRTFDEFKNFPGSFTYDYLKGAVTAETFFEYFPNGVFGAIRRNDCYEFGECVVENEEAIFTFHLLSSEKPIYAFPCPEVYFSTPVSNSAQAEHQTYQIRFGDTNFNLSPEFIKSFRALPMIASAEFAGIQEDGFVGTELVFTVNGEYAPHFQFNCGESPVPFVNVSIDFSPPFQ